MTSASRRSLLRHLGWIVPAVVSGSSAGAFPPDEGEVWKQFLAWLPTTQPSDHPGTLLQAYRSYLKSKNTSDPEATAQLAIIQKLMRTREDGWQQIFNNIYTSTSQGFSTRPNALLVSAVENRSPSRALDAGMGQGRNAVFLAIKGWDVTGFDVSDAGLEIARKNAAYAGVKLNAVHKSNETFDYGTAQWDLIVITYEPFPVSDEAYVRRVQNALRPGGLLVIESFASSAGSANRKPVDIDPEQLLRAMAAFRIRRFEDTEDIADWTLQKTRLVRLIAEKKPAG